MAAAVREVLLCRRRRRRQSISDCPRKKENPFCASRPATKRDRSRPRSIPASIRKAAYEISKPESGSNWEENKWRERGREATCLRPETLTPGVVVGRATLERCILPFRNEPPRPKICPPFPLNGSTTRRNRAFGRSQMNKRGELEIGERDEKSIGFAFLRACRHCFFYSLCFSRLGMPPSTPHRSPKSRSSMPK